MGSANTCQRQFPCANCGAYLQFEPGLDALKCPYCQTLNAIPSAGEAVAEQDYREALRRLAALEPAVQQERAKCEACGAESACQPELAAGRCPFCGAAMVSRGGSTRAIMPKALLPFRVRRQEAEDAFRKWVSSLWFAPSDLLRFAEADALSGVYLPYWTYDCNADTRYTGMRGDDYTEVQHYVTMENRRPVTRTRTVTRTRWRSVSGRVFNRFDDVLVPASRSLPRTCVERLEPWDLENLVPYRDEYLAGFLAESYQIDLEGGFELARQVMEEQICSAIRRDIGGDHQRIHTAETTYRDVTFKHILLPVWISAYLYRGKTYRFLVNARTGEVSGQRPWSAWKIAGLIALLALVVVTLWLVVQW